MRKKLNLLLLSACFSLLLFVPMLIAAGAPEGGEARPGSAAAGPPDPLAGFSDQQKMFITKPVEIDVAVEKEIEHGIDIIGTAYPVMESRVCSQISGLVTKVHKREYEYVKEGEPLAALERTDRELQLRQAKARMNESLANLRRLEIELEKAKDDLDRYRNLFKENLISRQELQSFETRYESLRAQMESAQASVTASEASAAIIEDALEKTTIRAPFSGFIKERLVEIGNWVSPGTGIVELIATDVIEIRGDVKEKDIGLVNPGVKVNIRFDAIADKTFVGELTKISPQADLITRAFPVRIVVDNKDHDIRSGMFARAGIIYEVRDMVTMLNQNAVDRRADGVYIARLMLKENRPFAALTKVELGGCAGDYVQVISNSPLKPGDYVITTGIENIMMPGQPVIVTNAGMFGLKLRMHPWMQMGPPGGARPAQGANPPVGQSSSPAEEGAAPEKGE